MNLEQNVAELNKRIHTACERIGANPKDIKTVAATKCVDISVINELSKYGINSVGENRVQEFLSKYTPSSRLDWQIIGALQTNKVKYVVGKVSLIQSVDRPELVAEIQKQSAKSNVTTNVLIEVNIGGEQNKSGARPDEIYNLATMIAECDNIKLCGLMSVPPIDAPTELYEKVKKLYDSLKKDYPYIEYLSMGMSNDLETAILSGANMIRPGRALFGARQ